MKKAIKVLLWTVSSIVLVIGIFLLHVIYFRPFSINIFYEKAFIEFAWKNPELLSELRLLEPLGVDFHNDDLTEASDAYLHELNDLVRRDLETLRSYDRTSQTPDQQLSTDILEWFLKNEIEGQKYLYHNYPVNQLAGIQSELPDFMANIHHVGKKRDAEHYITRLSKFDTKFDQVLEGLKIRENKGIVPPKFVIHKVLDQMRAFVNQPPQKNILYQSLNQKLEKVDSLSAGDISDLLRRTELEIQNTVYPSYEKMISYLEILESKATTDDGVWKLPDGDAFYAYALRSNTTTRMSPDEVHQLGLREVKRIQEEMKTILEAQGYSGKTAPEYLKELSEDPEYLYPDTEKGKKNCLADYQSIINEIDNGVSKAFDLRPNSGVFVEAIPSFKEKTSPGAYYQAPSLDGSRPGKFFVNLRDMKEIPKWGMRTLAYHEAIPGHHFQIAIQRQIQGVPTFRKIIPFTSYIEGWALYAEYLAWEMGFEKDPFDNLGRLQAELFRAVRLVVDTGIHKMRWTREQAIQYMIQNTGMPEGDVVAEIERYIVSPGQACAYKVGQLKILELRERVRRELNDAFDLKAFHNVVLKNGAMPLEILEQQVDRYIQGTKS